MATSSSLDILLAPKQRKMSASIASSCVTPPNGKASSTSQYLESLSCDIIDAINKRQFDDPVFQHIGTDLKADFGDMGFIQKVHVPRVDGGGHPNAHVRIQVLNSCSSVDEDGGKATVWITLSSSGIAKPGFYGVVRDNAMRAEWRRTRDGWKLTKYIGLYGLAV